MARYRIVNRGGWFYVQKRNWLGLWGDQVSVETKRAHPHETIQKAIASIGETNGRTEEDVVMEFSDADIKSGRVQAGVFRQSLQHLVVKPPPR